VTILADTPRWLRVGGVTGWLALGVTGAGAVIIWAVSYTSITLVSGIFAGLGALSSILFMLFIGSVILFMLLHGARDRTWFVRHSGLSAHTIEPVVDDAASAISGYFRGTTILAFTNAVPVALAAWLLGVPLVGAIALVTFITADVPFYGAIVAGVFALSRGTWQLRACQPH
jgi:predicted PurR-regulated permease PerM